jgi:hypothetical protein
MHIVTGASRHVETELRKATHLTVALNERHLEAHEAVSTFVGDVRMQHADVHREVEHLRLNMADVKQELGEVLDVATSIKSLATLNLGGGLRWVLSTGPVGWLLATPVLILCIGQ